MEPNESQAKEQVLLRQYMTILFLLVSFLSILGLFLLSRIYWKDASVAHNIKIKISQKQPIAACADTNFVQIIWNYA